MPQVFKVKGVGKLTQQQAYDRDRGSSSVRLYDAAWVKASKDHLCANPLCAYCALDGMVTAASLVDHFWPHRGDRALFWRREFWVSACASCHSGMKQAVERQGYAALDALAAQLHLPPLRGRGV
jgi:5-methylcytosine-specific restriction protein A